MLDTIISSTLLGYPGHDEFITEYIMKQEDRHLRLRYYNNTSIYYIVKEDVETWKGSLTDEQVDKLMNDGYLAVGYITSTNSTILNSVRFVEYIDTFVRGKNIALHMMKDVGKYVKYVLPRQPSLSSVSYWRRYIMKMYGYDNIHELIEDIELYKENANWSDLIRHCNSLLYTSHDALRQYIENDGREIDRSMNYKDNTDYSKILKYLLPDPSYTSKDTIDDSVANDGNIISLSLSENITYEVYNRLCNDIRLCLYPKTQYHDYSTCCGYLTFKDGRYIFIDECVGNIRWHPKEYFKGRNIAIPKRRKIDICLGPNNTPYTMDEKIRLLRVFEKYGFRNVSTNDD